jgi:acyl-coenzyme A thioesterase PaaI-like protein
MSPPLRASSPSEAPRTFWDVPEPTTDAWREKRRLAAALRELAALCVTTDAPETTLSYAADAASRIVEHLSAFPTRTFKDGWASCATPDDFAVFADRAPLTGESNPFAPPMHLHMQGDEAIGHIVFGPMFEGIPGCVHGGLVAAAFDQVFGYLQVKRGVRSLTGSLTVRYRKPTPLQTELRFEAHVERVEGRRSYVISRLMAGEEVTAEAEAIFIALDAERMQSMIVPKNSPASSEDNSPDNSED